MSNNATTANVLTGSVQVKTVPLTAKILKQIPIETGYTDRVREALKARTTVLGWVDGSAFGEERESRWLLILVGNGDYILFRCMPDTANKFDHLYVV